MRIPKDAIENKKSTDTVDFSSFAMRQTSAHGYPSMQQPQRKSIDLTGRLGQSSLMPGKSVMREMNKQPSVAIKKKGRLIVDSSDEEFDQVIKKKPKIVESSPEVWLDSRNPENITVMERERNIRQAMEDRKRAMKNPKYKAIQKKSKPQVAESDQDSEEMSDTPVKQLSMKEIMKKPFKSSLINDALEDYDPVTEYQEKTKKENGDVRSNRRKFREAAIKYDDIKDSTDDEKNSKKPKQCSLKEDKNPENVIDLLNNNDEKNVIHSDDDDDVKADDDRWDDNYTKSDIIEQAHKIIKHCEKLSLNLRQCLNRWRNTESGELQKGSNDCVDLTKINSSGNEQILRDEDLALGCPDLELKDYQLVGVNWLKLLHHNNVNGVMADDMGLGKTVQTIAFLSWLHHRDNTVRKRPNLIVVPASTLSNWQNEFERFCPGMNLFTYHGSQQERMNLRYDLKREIPNGNIDVILCTYTIFERESGKVDRAFLQKQSFDYLILDEAHCIKNSVSSRYENLNILRTKHRLLLSGTPVQNDIKELLALLSFLMPTVFGESNCELLVEAFGWEKGKNNVKVKGVSLQQVRGMLAPFVLRRLKKDVLKQLTAKIILPQKLNMTSSQRSVYEGLLLRHSVRKAKLLEDQKIQQEKENLLDGKVSGRGKKTSNEGNTIISVDVEDDVLVMEKPMETVDLCSPELPKLSGGLEKDGQGSETTTEGKSTTKEVIIENKEKEEKNEKSSSNTVNTKTEDLVEEITELQEMNAKDAKHLFTALRKAANHPLLLRVHYNNPEVLTKIARIAHFKGFFGDSCSFDQVMEEIETNFSDFDLHMLCLEYDEDLGDLRLDASVLYDSPKMMYLKTLLPKLQSEGHRSLVFSQWTRLLDLLEVLLNDLDLGFLRLDGSTPVSTRQGLIDQFNNDPSICVFLLSTKAGGMGINLTAADTVILHDLDFNPENDRQAEDRCHRIGQTKPVTIYKLITDETVDEDIFLMGEQKRQLSEAVLSDKRDTPVGKNSSTTGKNKGKKENEELDINSIGMILKKALDRVNRQQAEK